MNATLLRNYVAGAFRMGSVDRGMVHVNPSDADDLIARVPEGDPADVNAAVDAAALAYPAWRRLSGPARAEHLHRWAGEVERRADELARAVSREVGKPIGEARGEVARCVVILRYYAGEAVREKGEVVPAQAAGALQFTLRDPVGVVGLITPWNFPLAIPLWKAAPALAFGNTVVLKPSERSSHVTGLLAATASAADLPAGVFNVVFGMGLAGAALTAADAVRAVSFTGSTGAGAQVAAACTARNIRYQTEMGGKNVVIVLPDADLKLAAKLTANGAMRYAGQKCTATSRVVVAEDVEENFLHLLRAEIEALPLGPVDDPVAAVGPLINSAARDRVVAALEEAWDGRIFGGAPPRDSRLDSTRGSYFAPARDPRFQSADSNRSRSDELFGPVLGHSSWPTTWRRRSTSPTRLALRTECLAVHARPGIRVELHRTHRGRSGARER